MLGKNPAYLRMISLAHFHSLRYLFDGLVEAELSVVLPMRAHSMTGWLLDGWAVRLGFLFAAASEEAHDWLEEDSTLFWGELEER